MSYFGIIFLLANVSIRLLLFSDGDGEVDTRPCSKISLISIGQNTVKISASFQNNGVQRPDKSKHQITILLQGHPA